MVQNCTLPTNKVAYTVDETSNLLSVGRTSLNACIKSGKLRPTKLGRKTLFRAKDIDAFLDHLQGKEAEEC